MGELGVKNRQKSNFYIIFIYKMSQFRVNKHQEDGLGEQDSNFHNMSYLPNYTQANFQGDTYIYGWFRGEKPGKSPISTLYSYIKWLDHIVYANFRVKNDQEDGLREGDRPF